MMLRTAALSIEQLQEDKYNFVEERLAAASAHDPLCGTRGFEGHQGDLIDVCSVCDVTFATLTCAGIPDKHSNLWRTRTARDRHARLKVNGRRANSRIKPINWNPRGCPACCVCLPCLSRVCAFDELLRAGGDAAGGGGMDCDEEHEEEGFFMGGDWQDENFFLGAGVGSPIAAARRDAAPPTPLSPLNLRRTDAADAKAHVTVYIAALSLAAFTAPIAYAHDDVMLLPRCKNGDKDIVLVSDTFHLDSAHLTLTLGEANLVCVIKKRILEGS